jgi:hypothetical protein
MSSTLSFHTFEVGVRSALTKRSQLEVELVYKC